MEEQKNMISKTLNKLERILLRISFQTLMQRIIRSIMNEIPHTKIPINIEGHDL